MWNLTTSATSDTITKDERDYDNQPDIEWQEQDQHEREA